MNAQLVIGAGEVGTALAEVLDCPVRDVAPHTGFYQVLHIAFPWSRRFVRTVWEYQGLHQARMVIVHSTVPVGTCDREGWVHSPVRGRHPDLTKGLLAFPKHFGGARALAASDRWKDALLPGTQAQTVEHKHAATTEAGKLWELATYGAEIAMQKRIHAWCAEQGLDFEEVYTEFGQTYNDGWRALGEDHLVKRLIEHRTGPIGGHCVTQNAPMLGEEWVQELLEPHSPDGVW